MYAKRLSTSEVTVPSASRFAAVGRGDLLRRRFSRCVVAAVIVAAAACGGAANTAGNDSEGAGVTTEPTNTTSETTDGTTADTESTAPADASSGDHEKVAFDPDSTVESIEAFWADAATEAGLEPYEALDPSRIQALNGKPVVCEGDEVPDSDVADNAVAFGCELEGYAVMWDPKMMADLETKFGASAPASVLAHEWGHILDFQSSLNFEGVIAEQFADCMSGVWVAHEVQQGVQPFDSPSSLDSTVSAAADFSDQAGDDSAAEDAHGLAFDRIRAFQEGYERGASFCVAYKDTPPSLTETPFTGEDTSTGGNLEFSEGFDLVSDALAEFIAANPKPFTPSAVELTFLTKEELQELHERLGDSATVVVLATDTAASAQRDLGEDPEEDGPLLQQACWAGAFLGWVAEGKSSVMELSPGDLDEAVAAFADLTDPAAEGFLFEQVAQMRTGFTDGVRACTVPER